MVKLVYALMSIIVMALVIGLVKRVMVPWECLYSVFVSLSYNVLQKAVVSCNFTWQLKKGADKGEKILSERKNMESLLWLVDKFN